MRGTLNMRTTSNIILFVSEVPIMLPFFSVKKIEVQGITIRSDMLISNRKCDQVLIPSAVVSKCSDI